MKSLKIFGIFTFLSLFSFVSCKKDDTSEDKNAPGDAAVSQYLFDALKDEVDQQINRQAVLNGLQSQEIGDRGSCATVSITPLGAVFPKTVIITFPEGCTTIAGAQIQGTIQLNISDRVRENGTVVRFSLKDFQYKRHQLSGDYTITFTEPFSHRTEIQNGVVITPEGKTIRYNSINTATQTEGRETTFRTNPLTFLLDDGWQVNTNSWGINSRGVGFTLSTVTPLEYKITCQWITKGMLSIQEEGTPAFNALLDFGDGTCDNKVQLTIGNVVREIRLP